MPDPSPDADLRLIPLAPGLPPLHVARGHRASVGRRSTHDLTLPHADVSRDHADLMQVEGRWIVLDRSLTGTFVDGERVEDGDVVALADGDRIRFGAWPYLVRIGAPTISTASPSLSDRSPASIVTLHDPGDGGAMAIERFASMMLALTQLRDAEALRRRTLEIALRETGFSRAAIVRPAGDGELELQAMLDASGDGTRPFSRELVHRAMGGEAVAIEGVVDELATVAELHIHSAVCVPIEIGGDMVGCLYLDAREQERGAGAGARAVATGLAHAHAMAMGNLRRLELESRQRTIRSELEAAQEVQGLLLPASQGTVGPVRYACRVRPGLAIAGDFFDVTDPAPGHAALFVGDVSGHGIGPAMQMAMVQSLLHASLRRGTSLVDAIVEADRIFQSKSGGGRFVTLWASIIEPDGTVHFVDAGHAHAYVRRADGTLGRPPHVRSVPLGIPEGPPPECGRFTLEPGDALVLYTDGMIEQPGPEGDRFGDDRLETAITAASGSPMHQVTTLFDTLDRYRGPLAQTDDTTVAIVERPGSC